MKKTSWHILLLVVIVGLLSSCASLRGSGKTKSLTFDQQSRFDQVYFEASKLKILGDITGSAQKFADALKIDPSSHATMYQLANLNIAAKNYHEAIYWAEKSIEFNKTYNFWYYGQLAQSYSRVSNWKKSAETFKIMIDKEPDRKSNYMEAANQYINAHEFKSAISVLDTYQKKFGIDEESARKKEGLFFEIEKPKEAIEVMKELSEAYPEEVRYKGLLAESYVRNNQFDEALDVYTDILRENPDNGFAHFGLADVYRRLDKPDLSFTHLSKAFDDANVSAKLKIQVMGTFYPFIRDDEQMRDQALELGSKLIHKHPLDAPAFIAYSDILYAASQPIQARNYLLRATEIDPGKINVWQKILSLDDELNNLQLLVIDSEQALEYFPNHIFLYIVNAFANYTLANFSIAQKVALEGLEISVLDKDRVDLFATLGDASHELGDHEKSDAAFEELLELDPDNDGALNNYAYYLSLRKIDLDKALNMIQKALQIRPQQATYIDTHGWVLFQRGEFQKAVVVLKDAFELMSQEAEVVRHYALALIKTGKGEEGGKLIQRADELEQRNRESSQP